MIWEYHHHQRREYCNENIPFLGKDLDLLSHSTIPKFPQFSHSPPLRNRTQFAILHFAAIIFVFIPLLRGCPKGGGLFSSNSSTLSLIDSVTKLQTPSIFLSTSLSEILTTFNCNEDKKHCVPGHILVYRYGLSRLFQIQVQVPGMKKSTIKLPIITCLSISQPSFFLSLKAFQNTTSDKIPCFLSSFARSCNLWFLAKPKTGKVSFFAMMRERQASPAKNPPRPLGMDEEKHPPRQASPATPQEGNGGIGSPQTTL